MNGVHDLGGMHGFGPVEREENEPVFHASWEKSVLAISESVRRTYRLFNVDEFRRGIEQMDPARYLASSYYERWLTSIVTNLFEKGILTEAELEARTELLRDDPRADFSRLDDSALVGPVPGAGAPVAATLPDDVAPPRFAVGDPVIARNVHPVGHTRLPRYVRGKHGVIDRFQGVQTFPDTNAQGLGPHPQAVYSVRFEGRELWGDSAEPRESLYIDLWESYLSPARADRHAMEVGVR